MHGMYGGMSHLGSGRTEILFHFFFDHQSLRGLGASDPFVKVSRNLRIDFPYPAVQNHQLFWKKAAARAVSGTIASTHRARRKLMDSMTTTAPSM